MAGLFDDLIPDQGGAPAAGGGMFDDLIPKPQGGGRPSAAGMFDDLVPQEPGFFERIANDVRTGFLRRVQQANVAARDRPYSAPVTMGGERVPLSPEHLLLADPEQAARIEQERQIDLAGEIVRVAQEIAQVPQRPVMEQIGSAETAGEWLEAFAEDPLGAIGGLATQSAAQMAPELLMASRLPARVAAPLFGLGSGRAEYEAAVLDIFDKHGVDLTSPESVREALANPDLMAEAEARGLTRGAIIGALDTLTAGAAGRNLIPRTAVSGTASREAANLGAQAAVQMAGGGGGEALAQLATDGEVFLPDVLSEMAGELGSAPIDVAVFGRDRLAARQAARQQKQPPAPPPAPEEPVTVRQSQQPAPEFAAPPSPPAAMETPDSPPGSTAPVADPSRETPVEEIRRGPDAEPALADASVGVQTSPDPVTPGAVESGGPEATVLEARGAGRARPRRAPPKGPLRAYAERPVGRSFYTRVFEDAGYSSKEAELLPADTQFEIVTDQLKKRYGFRAVQKEPGLNWREALDATLDAYQNLESMAAVLNAPINAMSLGGKLDLRLTRGGDGALAWYMPGTRTVAVSRRNSSYAHEWMHAFDHFILERSGARNIDLVRGQLFTGKLRQGLDLSRMEPSLVGSFAELMQAMYKNEAKKAAMVRDLELKIEAEKDPKKLEQYKRQLANVRRNQPPESSFYQGAKTLDRKKFASPEDGESRGYWQRPTEMLARAGEAYVAWKIEQAGGGVDFVAKGTPIYTKEGVEFFQKAYPQKEERLAIFAAFDRLFETASNLAIFGTERPPAPRTDNVHFDNMDPRLWASTAKPDPFEGAPWYRRLVGELAQAVQSEAKATKRDLDELRNRWRNTKAQLDEPMLRYLERLLASSLYTGRGALLFLKKVYPKSAAIDELFRKLITRPGTGEFTARTYEEAVSLYVGQKGNVFRRIVDKYDLGSLTEAESRALRDLLAGVRKTGPTRLVEAARDIGFFLDQIWYDVTQAGIDIGYTKENYLPRLYDHYKIESNPQKFLQAAEKVYELMGVEKPAAAAEEWLTRIRTHGLDNFDKVGIASSMTAGRKLPAEADALLADFMILEPLELVQTYVLQAARRIAWAERFGANDQGLNELIDQMAKEGLRSKDITLAKTVVDVAAGRRRSDLPQPVQAYLAWLHAVGTMALLPRATIASLAEPATAAIRSGDVRDAARAFGKMVAQAARTGEGREIRELSEFLGIVSDTLTDQMLASRFGGTFTDPKAATRLLGRFFHRTGLHGYTAASRAAALPLADAYLRTWAKTAVEGKSAAAGPVLSELGINPSHIDAFSKWLLELGRRPTIADLEAAPPLMRDLYTTAVNRFVDEAIQNPKALDKPILAHNPVGRLLFGITGFLYAFQRNVLARSAHMLKAAATGKYGGVKLTPAERMGTFSLALIPPFVTLIALQYAVSIMREMLFNPERFDDDDDLVDQLFNEEMALLGLSRAGVFGVFDIPMNAYTGLKYQRDLANVMIGAVPGFFAQGAQRMAQPLTSESGTNTPEYNAVRGFWQVVATPALIYALTQAPGGPLLSPAYGGAMMALTSPRLSHDVAEAVVGPKGTKVERKQKDRE